MKDAISVLKSEHRSLSAVLQGLKQLSRDAQDAVVRPDFQVFRAMLRYIDEFPERLHHPKEDQYLFSYVAARSERAQPVIRELMAEHQEGARLIRELERALLFFEEGWPAGAREFQNAVDAYAEFHWKHMRKEEEVLLPMANEVLTSEDWKQINEAFAANRDPVEGVRERDFEQLFSRIANLAPAPIGLGEPWKKPAQAHR